MKTEPPVAVQAALGQDVRPSLTEQAYLAVRQAIVNAELRPGGLIAENALALRLGMSRTPVREAILRLRHEGWVHSIPRRGLFISPISAEDVRKNYELLEGMEAVIARLAVERATGDQVAQLGEHVARMESTVETDDRRAWLAADMAFHDLLTEIADNERIKEFCRRISDQLLNRASALLLWIRPRPIASTQEHRALYEAIQRRDVDAAIRIAHAHRARVREEFVRLLIERVPGHSASESGWAAGL